MKKLIRCANQYIWEEDHRTVKILSPVPGHLRRHGSAGGKEKDGPQSRLSVLCHKLYPSYGQIHPDYMV